MDFLNQSIIDIGILFRSGRISCEELTSHLLEKIEHMNPALNAFVTVTSELAMKQAKRADEDLAQGMDRGPFHGIPIAVKDLFATNGIKTTC